MTRLTRNANWYRHRLAAMSGPEILHRVQEGLRRRSDRGAGARLLRSAPYTALAKAPMPNAPITGPLPEQIPGLRDGLERWDVPTETIAEWEADLRRAESGRFFLLGQEWPAHPRADRWHLDPVTGSTWPRDAYCFDIDYRHAPGMGDVKFVWELGRLQYLQSIAALACKRRDPAVAAFCCAELEDWIDGNPPHRGVHWASGIELAIRLVSMFVVTTLVGEHLTAGQRGKLRATVAAHAIWLERYPSRFSSANNHRTAEGLGLFLAGALCADQPHAGLWRATGWDMLHETARLQILPDGVGAEQTITYTAVVLEMLLLGHHVARALDHDIPDDYFGRIVAGAEYLRWFTDEAGGQPRIGDDDNARVLGAYSRGETYVRSILAGIAAVAQRPDLTPPQPTPHLRQCVFGAPPAATDGPVGVRTFEHGGYTVGRHARAKGAVMVAMDHGYLGYLSIAAHGHADALSVWLHLGDQPVLVDAGTYLYHAGGAWRDHFRGTPAHNTLCLQGADSSIASGNFNWSHKATATLHIAAQQVAHQHDGPWSIEASHDGYRKAFGAIHRRRLTVSPAEGFTIEDRLSAASPHAVAIGFLLHPALVAFARGDGVAIARDGAELLRLHHQGPLTPIIGHPGTPDGGWYSPTFGVKLAATRIVYAGQLAPSETSVTRFAWS